MAKPWALKTEMRQLRPGVGSDYYQRVGDLQQSLRDSERRRLKLERKLFEYSRSNRAVSHLKYVKLTNALKEICEWEKKAQRRNQEILQDFDRIEAHARTLITSTDKLQKMKSEYEKYMQRIMPVWKKSAQTTQDQEESDRTELLADGKQAGINMSLSRGSYHPATIFMSRQMSANSSIEHFSTQHKSPQPTKSFSIDDPNSCRQAAKSSTVTDSSVIQTNSDIQCLNKSDKIDGKTSLQISKKAAITSSISSEHEKTHSVDIESVTSNRSHSVEDEQSGRLSSQLHERLSPEYRNKDLKYYRSRSKVEEAVAHEDPVINEERLEPCHRKSLLGATNERSSDKHGAWEGKDLSMEGLWPITSAQELDIDSLNSSSDLTVSISESDDSATPTKPVVAVQGLYEVRGPVHTEHEEGGCSITSPHMLGSGMSFHLETNQLCLSEDGFFHLLQSLEEMLYQPSPERCKLYQHTTLSAAKVEELIWLANRRMALKESDLEACTAVVLEQLQRLQRNTLNVAFLPEKDIIDNPSSTDDGTPKRYDSSLHSTSCQKRLYQHALFLKENHLFQKDNMTGMLNALLATKNAEQIFKTESLSKKVLREEREEVCSIHGSEEVSSIHSRGSPCSLLSTESDMNEAKQAKPAHRPGISKMKQQEMTASQVPKTTDHSRQCLSKEENELESISEMSSLEQQPGVGSSAQKVKGPESGKISSEMSGSSSERSPLTRSESKKKVVTTTKSKAFWGESDDSTTDIEEVLRPQNTEADDFDDFYD